MATRPGSGREGQSGRLLLLKLKKPFSQSLFRPSSCQYLIPSCLCEPAGCLRPSEPVQHRVLRGRIELWAAEVTLHRCWFEVHTSQSASQSDSQSASQPAKTFSIWTTPSLSFKPDRKSYYTLCVNMPPCINIIHYGNIFTA